MNSMRKRLFEIVELAADGDRVSAAYDSAMLFLIVLSMVPLAFKTETPALAQSVGGVLREKISGRTSYLVKGDVSDLPDWALDRKLHKAEELIESGKGIQIINEAEFMRLIADAKNVLSAH